MKFKSLTIVRATWPVDPSIVGSIVFEDPACEVKIPLTNETLVAVVALCTHKAKGPVQDLTKYIETQPEPRSENLTEWVEPKTEWDQSLDRKVDDRQRARDINEALKGSSS